MPATLARVALITEKFRWDLQQDPSVKTKRLQAVELEEESVLSSAVGAADVNADVFELLKGDRQLIEVELDPMPAGVSFDQLAPAATLAYEPLELTREVLVVGKRTQVRPDGAEKGTLLLW